MPLTDENRGTNADGSRSEDYCVYCYKNGQFTQKFTMNQMIEFCHTSERTNAPTLSAPETVESER